MNKNNIFVKNNFIFKKILTRLAMLYSFENPLNVWPNGGQLDFLFLFFLIF